MNDRPVTAARQPVTARFLHRVRWQPTIALKLCDLAPCAPNATIDAMSSLPLQQLLLTDRRVDDA